jgi:hypothetical protein
MLSGSQFKGEKAYVGLRLLEKLKNKLNLFKFIKVSIFEMSAGCIITSGEPLAALGTRV